MRISQLFYDDQRRPAYRKEYLNTFVEPFQRSLFDRTGEITTVVAPLNFEKRHWGMLSGRRLPKASQRVESRLVTFGERIRWKCPSCVIEFFEAGFDCGFHRKGVRWNAYPEKYILDVLKSEKQPDSYSWGAYVLAAFSAFVSSTGYLPEQTFYSGYDSSITYKYKWASTRSRVMKIIYAYEENGDVGVAKEEVSAFQRTQ